MKTAIGFCLYFDLWDHLWTNCYTNKTVIIISKILQRFLAVLYDVKIRMTLDQNRAKSLQDFMPLLSSGWFSFIKMDSRNANFSQLSVFLMIFVFSLTAFICKAIGSTSSSFIWRRPTMCCHPGQVWKCLLMALFLSDQPCSFVQLNSVDSVFPMYVWRHPGHEYSYTKKELLRSGVLSLLEV